MALWPFKPSTLLDADTLAWHVDIACWFLRNCGDALPQKPARLILPGSGFYRLTESGGAGLVKQVFEQTKTFAGLAEWQVDVISRKSLPLARDMDVVEAANDLGGRDAPRPAISYLPEWQDDPFRLITWFARALARMLVDAIAEPPPCEDAHRRAAADVVAGLLGFGVFLADGAIISRTNYIDRAHPDAALGETEFVFDLALYLTLHRLSPEGAERFLKATLADVLKPALRDAAPFRLAMLAAQAKARP